MKRMAGWLALGWLSGLGCGGDDGSTPSNMECGGGARFAQVAIFKKCTMCHSSTLSGTARRSAPAEINFDVYASTEKYLVAAVGAVKAGDMPPPGSGVTVTDAEKQGLYAWDMCGAPE